MPVIRQDFAFAKDYRDARTRFLNAARVASASVRSSYHEVTGPLGEELSTDVAWIGNPDAPNVLVLMTGTHGVELYCGSACVIDILLNCPLPEDWAACIIHAVNPWGAAWVRRENEHNIDINRNYVDYDQPLVRNDLYQTIHADLILNEISEEAIAASDRAIAKAEKIYGARAVLTARSAGQYEYSDGLHYGGTVPSSSRSIVDETIERHGLSARDRLVVLDYHTGAGPFGYCEPIFLVDPQARSYPIAQSILGQWLTTQRDERAVTPPQTGLGSELWERRCGPAAVFLALEFGTYPMTSSGGVLREDNWLHRQPGGVDWSCQTVQRVKRRLREEYDPQSSMWRSLVLNQNRLIFERFCDHAKDLRWQHRNGIQR